jgi:hypothetical protein
VLSKKSTQSNVQNVLDSLMQSKFTMKSAALDEEKSADLEIQLNQALDHPLDYPPLRASVFQGDRVAIALQTGIPRAAELLSMLLKQLFQAGIQLQDLTVVIHPESAAEFGFSTAEIESASRSNETEAPQVFTKSIDRKEIAFQIHKSSCKTCVSYLAANEAGHPIYMNRQLVDADVILPIGFPTPGEEKWVQDCLYPNFSSLEVKDRFASGEMSSRAQSQEIQLANDTLGSFFSIQVVHGPGGKIEKIFSGARDSVQQEALRVAEAVWKYHGPTDSSVTLATIETTTGKATWDDFIRAVIMAGQISVNAAPIVVWSELEGKPSRQIRDALLTQFDEGTSRKLSPGLKRLIGIIQEHPVYLHSKLARNDVEALGLGYVDSAAEVNRIAESCQQGVILRDAHKYQIVVDSSA